MSILNKLYKKINESTKEKVTFETHEPTHLEYPDYVQSYCYRIKSESPTSRFGDLSSYITANFVLPRNVNYQELGFNIGYVSSMGMKGGAQLSFLTEKDANSFIEKYLKKYGVTPYISANNLKLVRIDNYSDIPCYVDVNYSNLPVKSPEYSEKISQNLLRRLMKKEPVYTANPFLTQDANLAKKQTSVSDRNEKFVTKINKKLEVMKDYCTNITELINYKNFTGTLSNKVIMEGAVDKQIPQDIYSYWDIYYNNKKEQKFLMYLKTTSTGSQLSLRTKYDRVTLNLNLNNLSSEIKEMFNNSLFLKILADELAKTSDCKIRDYKGGDGKTFSLRKVTKYGPEMFRIEKNMLKFSLYDIEEVQLDNIEEIQTLIDFINNTKNSIEKAIDKAKEKFLNSKFTLDIFDEEEEE